MEVDFSSINLQYLLQVRDIAQQHPELASAVLGLPMELTDLFVHAPDECLVEVTKIKTPLLVAKGDAWWWSRLFNALNECRQDEIKAVLEHGSLAAVVQV